MCIPISSGLISTVFKQWYRLFFILVYYQCMVLPACASPGISLNQERQTSFISATDDTGEIDSERLGTNAECFVYTESGDEYRQSFAENTRQQVRKTPPSEAYRQQNDDSEDPAFLAGQKISGSPIPGILEHLLIRPLPEDDAINAGHMSISLVYPSIGRNDVDGDIRRWVVEIADSFQSNFDYNELSKETLGTDQDAIDRVDLHGDFRVERPSPKALSIIFELWNSVGPGHPNLDVITLNYSLINGQRLQLADIFAHPNEALQLMSNWSRSVLAKRYGETRTQMLQHGTEALPENFSSVALTPSGIRMYFQPYQVAMWEMGVQTVDMPLEALRAAEPFLAIWEQ